MVQSRGLQPRSASSAGFVRVLVGLFAVAAVVVIAAALRDRASHPDPVSVVVVCVLLAALLVAAFVLPWSHLPRRHTFWLALTQIVVTIVLAADLYPTNNAIPLLAVIPVLWTAFHLDWPHTLAMVAALGVGCVAFVVVVDPMPHPVRVVTAVSIFYFVVSSLALLTQINAQALRTSRGVAEEALLAQRATLVDAERSAAVMSAIAHGVDASVFYSSYDQTSTFANQRAAAWGEQMGVDPSSASWHGDHVYGTDRSTPIPADQQIVPRALRGEFSTGTLMWIGPPGAQRAISASSLPAVTESGEEIGAVVVGHDITDLVEALHAAESFSATVAHELRTPLTSIVGYLDLLEEDDLDENGREFLRRAQQGVTSLSTKLRELLEPFEVATATPHFTLVDLVALIDRRLVPWRRACAERGITLTGPSGEASLEVPLDRDLIGRLFDALVSNAVKFSRDGGEVDVTVTLRDDRARIVVTDHGFGMTPEERRHAFDRFYRSPSAIRAAQPGFGLGLSTARSIAEAHGGSIELASAAGVGTTATVELSLTQSDVLSSRNVP